MRTLLNLLVTDITVGIAEIIIFSLGAIALGFAIHLFITSRKNTKLQMGENGSGSALQEADEWKLKYFNDTEELEKRIVKQQQDLARYQHELNKVKENEEFLSLEIESLRAEREELLETQATLSIAAAPKEESHLDYLGQLRETQQHVQQYNQHIHQLLGQIDQLKAMELKHQELMQSNESLNRQIGEMRVSLVEKEQEIRGLRQQNRLGEEMQQRLEKVYADYNGLLEKMHKLESHVSHSQKEGTSYAELQDSYFKVTKELDEFKLKYLHLLEENQRLTRSLAEVEDKFRETNFQRQQLQKKASYLEELNQDLQQVAEQHNKLHSQMRRIAEIEQLLAKATQLSGSTDKEDPAI
jgi:chromosome segregation ATPase